MPDQSIDLDDTFKEDERTSFQNLPMGISKAIPLGNGEILACVSRRNPLTALADYECPPCECPPEAYEGCEEGYCGFVPEKQADPDTGECVTVGFTLCCRGCSGDDACKSPIRHSLFYHLLAELNGFNTATSCGIIYTECAPNALAGSPHDEDSLISSLGFAAPESSPLLQYLRRLATPAGRLAHVKVQSVNDPSVFVPIVIPLRNEPARISLPKYGWIIHIVPNALPSSIESFPLESHVSVHPPVSPVAHTSFQDEAFSASISLPEAGGMRQYWVTVPDSSRHPQSPLRYAILPTTKWTVTLYRWPTTESMESGFKKRKCGCEE